MSETKKATLNVALAVTDQLSKSYQKMLAEYTEFFKKNQGAFQGIKKTYDANVGTMDYPAERKNEPVITTVQEKMDWLIESSAKYLNTCFNQEATNGSGQAKAFLMIQGVAIEMSTVELLKLKSILESSVFVDMLSSLPVREDKEIWSATTDEQYVGRAIFESPKIGPMVVKTTVNTLIIVPDPNIEKLGSKTYTPITDTKKEVIELGRSTSQKFSGAITQRERAEILRRRSELLVNVLEAIKRANETELIESNMTSAKLFNFLLKGKLA